jgi:hypothetical protein
MTTTDDEEPPPTQVEVADYVMVASLRALADRVDEIAKDVPQPAPGRLPLVTVYVDANNLRNAADEIERLWAIVDRFDDAIIECRAERERIVADQMAQAENERYLRVVK